MAFIKWTKKKAIAIEKEENQHIKDYIKYLENGGNVLDKEQEAKTEYLVTATSPVFSSTGKKKNTTVARSSLYSSIDTNGDIIQNEPIPTEKEEKLKWL